MRVDSANVTVLYFKEAAVFKLVFCYLLGHSRHWNMHLRIFRPNFYFLIIAGRCCSSVWTLFLNHFLAKCPLFLLIACTNMDLVGMFVLVWFNKSLFQLKNVLFLSCFPAEVHPPSSRLLLWLLPQSGPQGLQLPQTIHKPTDGVSPSTRRYLCKEDRS